MLEASIAQKNPAGSQASRQMESWWIMLPTSACNVKSRGKNLPCQHQLVASKHKHLLHGWTANYRGTSELENTNQIYEHAFQSMCVRGVACACIGKCDQARFQPYPSSQIPIQNQAH